MTGNFKLQLFAEEGAVSAPAGETTNATEESSSPVSRSARSSAAERRRAVLEAKGNTPQIKPVTTTGAEPAEGKTTEQAAVTNPEPNQTEDKAAKFEELISGEYKDQFGERIKKILADRFKNNSTAMEKANAELDKYKAIADRVAGRYSLDGADTEALLKALDDDDALIEEAADAAGMSVEQFKAFQQMKAKSKRDDDLIAELVREKNERVNFIRMKNEETEIRKTIPEYDFLKESQNPIFKKLISAGVPQIAAYQTVHADEIRSAEIKKAVDEAEARFKAAVGHSQSRPSVLGSASNATAANKYSQMTPEERKEAVKKARFSGL